MDAQNVLELTRHLCDNMAVVAQLVERWLVVPDAAGSSPVDRPNHPLRHAAGSGTKTNTDRLDTLVSAGTGTVLQQEKIAHFYTPWLLIVWDDPINLMNYVVYVFRTHFGYPPEKAEHLMLLVHNEGHAIVANGPREQMEIHAQAMHGYGLNATISKNRP